VALDLLTDIADQHKGVSYADLFQLASATAIEVCSQGLSILVLKPTCLAVRYPRTTRLPLVICAAVSAASGRPAHPAALRSQGHDGGQGVRAGGPSPRCRASIPIGAVPYCDACSCASIAVYTLHMRHRLPATSWSADIDASRRQAIR